MVTNGSIVGRQAIKCWSDSPRSDPVGNYLSDPLLGRRETIVGRSKRSNSLINFVVDELLGALSELLFVLPSVSGPIH